MIQNYFNDSIAKCILDSRKLKLKKMKLSSSIVGIAKETGKKFVNECPDIQRTRSCETINGGCLCVMLKLYLKEKLGDYLFYAEEELSDLGKVEFIRVHRIHKSN